MSAVSRAPPAIVGGGTRVAAGAAKEPLYRAATLY